MNEILLRSRQLIYAKDSKILQLYISRNLENIKKNGSEMFENREEEYNIRSSHLHQHRDIGHTFRIACYLKHLGVAIIVCLVG